MRIEIAHLYVEKYSRQSHELFLDFVKEDEFIFFQNRGDYTSDMQLPTNRFTPTMLRIHDCMPVRTIRENDMLAVNMNALIEMAKSESRTGINNQENIPNRPAMVFLEVDNGREFAKLIDDEETVVTRNIPSEFYYRLEPSWNDPPCALEQLGDKYDLRIWDVGQGSTNSISYRNNVVLFDFGASIYYSNLRHEEIVHRHESLFCGQKRISLIISHWDCDHINLLCEVEDTFLERICCVFYPPGILSLTAKQIAMRIQRNCLCRVEIPPKPRAIWNKCGIRRVYASERYILYTGEISKNPNQSGLLLALKSKTAITLLTADHTNYQIWGTMFNDVVPQDKCLNVVVPHHGGNCGRTAVQTVISPGIAVISVGSNTYGHPALISVAAYRRAHYRLVRTDVIGDDIVIHMK